MELAHQIKLSGCQTKVNFINKNIFLPLLGNFRNFLTPLRDIQGCVSRLEQQKWYQFRLLEKTLHKVVSECVSEETGQGKRGQVMLRDCSLKRERDIFLVNSSTMQKNCNICTAT